MRLPLVTGAGRVIHVHYADRRELAAAVIDDLVTAEDRARLTPTMHERRRTEYLAGRALLRHALARHAGVRAAESTLTSLLGQMAIDRKREVTWDEMMKSA